MQLEISRENGVLVVTPLEKRLDVASAETFRATLVEQVDAGHRSVLVNLAHVDFIDTAGLGALVAVRHRLGKDGDLRVCSLTPCVRAMFELTLLHKVIPIAGKSMAVVAQQIAEKPSNLKLEVKSQKAEPRNSVQFRRPS